MPSAIEREICYHPNANKYFVVSDGERFEITDEGVGLTVADKITEMINQGAIDRRPGAPNALTGLDAVQYLESLELAKDD